MTANTHSLGHLLMQGRPDLTATNQWRRQLRRATVPALMSLSLACLWASLAPLAGAVVAPAQLKVELNRKTVQHQEGGIVREILVRDGQKVRAGEALLLLSDLRGDAELRLLQDQSRAEQVRLARASAEASLASSFMVPAGHADGAELVARELALFTARRRALDEQIASLHTQKREAQAQAEALNSQVLATEAGASLSDEELLMNEQLVQQGFIQRTRLLSLQRTSADYRSKVGEQRGSLAVARQRIGELEARALALRNQYQQQATDEMRDASARLRQIEERLRPSQDQVERQTVRSPVDGEVMGLRVASVGEVIAPRAALLDVVPAQEKLVVEARIRPDDINQVRAGSSADVRLTAPDARNLPMLPGTVSFVSADRITGPSGEAWFTATVEVDAASLKQHPGLRPHAGMPVELFVTTTERSLFEYFVEPLGLFARRGLRES
ncbi:MAG: HlyD family type I secretion periplasmic adaptor subunit [Rhizobacter sp.]|nr:HlyD family type I secretion periplasmic adaptor subunit [Rhizobacter sp.]